MSFLCKRHFYSACLALVIALWWTEIDPELWSHEESATYNQGKVLMFKYVTNPTDVPEVNLNKYLSFSLHKVQLDVTEIFFPN